MMANSQRPRGMNEINVIFHVHIPKEVGKDGHPVVLGDGKELGLWEHPIVKLHQPSQNQYPTYWQSDPVTISLSNFAERGEIQYKYAIHVVGWFKEKVIFEGESNLNNRTLDIKRNNQF